MSDKWIKDAANEIEPYTFLDVAQIIARHYSTEAERVQELRRVTRQIYAAFHAVPFSGEGECNCPMCIDVRKALEAWGK